MGTMPPMVFGCTTCNGNAGFEKAKGFKPVRYHMWVRHLTDDRHQERVKRFYPNLNSLRSELPVDDNRYVIVGMPQHMGQHLLFRLAVWLAEFGVLTDLVYLKEKGLVTATIQAVGLGRRGKGVERAENIVNETEFKSDKYTIPIKVFRKDRMTNEDWLAIERGQVSRELTRKTKSPPDFVPFQARNQHSNKENVKAGSKKRRNKRRAGDVDRSSNCSPEVAQSEAALKEVTKEADNIVHPPARQQIIVGEEVALEGGTEEADQVASVQPNNIGNGNRRETLVSCETSGNDSILNHGGSLSIHGADDQLGGRPRDDEFPMEEIQSTEAALVRRNSSCSRRQRSKSRIVHDILETLGRDNHAHDQKERNTTCAGDEATTIDRSESTSVTIKTTIDKEGAAQPTLPPAEKTNVAENVGQAKAAKEPENPHVSIVTENVVQVQAAKDIEPPKVFNETAKMKDATSDPDVRGKPDKVFTRESALSSKSSGEADVILSSSSPAEIKEASMAVGSASEPKRVNECQEAAPAPPANEDENDSWKYSTFKYWSIR